MNTHDKLRKELFEKIEVQLKEVNEVAFHLFEGKLLAHEIDKAIKDRDYEGIKVKELIRDKKRRLQAEVSVLSKMTEQLCSMNAITTVKFLRGIDDVEAIMARVDLTVTNPSIELIAKGINNPDGSDVFKFYKVNDYLRKSIYGATKTSLEGLEPIMRRELFMKDEDEDYDY